MLVGMFHISLHFFKQILMLEQTVSKSALELGSIERSVHNEIMSIKKMDFWVRNGKDVGVPVYGSVRFMQREQFRHQTQNIYTLYQPSATNAQCNIGFQKYPDVGRI